MTVMERTPEPLVREIESLVEGVHGWSPVDELFALSMLAYATSHLPGDIVEVGSWLGRSAVVLATAARHTHGLVHCIDLFPERNDWRQNPDGSYSFAVTIDGRDHGAYEGQTVWKEPFEQQLKPLYDEGASIRERFDANLRAKGVSDLVRAHRGTAVTFARQAPGRFRSRLVFIDGDHGYHAVKDDIACLERFLVPGGWICFDDAFSSYEGVDRAITERVIDNPAYDIKRQLTRKCFAARRALA